MIGESALIKRLIRAAERAKNELFQLHARDWNDAVEVYRRSRPLIVKGDYRGGWLHPWQFSVSWNSALERWETKINAGFVNGLDAEVSVPTETAPEETLERIGQTDKTKVNAFLTEEPLVPIPTSSMRALGPDGVPTGTSGEGFNSKITYEGVPPFFAALGVGEPPEQRLDPTRGIVTTSDFTNQESLNARRLLRAIEVTLTKDRPAAQAEWSTGTGFDGTFAQFNVGYSSALNSRERAYVGFSSKFEPSQAAAGIDRITGAAQDDPFDRVHLATIYFMSPSGEREGAPISKDWQPFVKHRIFWNVNHTTNRLPFMMPDENLTFDFPLAGGAGTGIIASYLSNNNDAFDLARELLASRALSGKFWST